MMLNLLDAIDSIIIMSERSDLIGDLKANKIMQGYLMTKLSNTKDWIKKWVVLTKDYMYTFHNNALHNVPIEKIVLRQVQFITSFFVTQSRRSHVLCIKFREELLYIQGQNSQEKRAWAFAIEKTIEILQNPEIEDSKSVIRDRLRKYIGVLYDNQIRKSAYRVSQYQDANKKHKRLSKHYKIMDQKILPFITNSKSQDKQSSLPSESVDNKIQISLPSFPEKTRIKSKRIELKQKIIERVIIQRIVEIQRKGSDIKEKSFSIVNKMNQCTIDFNDKRHEQIGKTRAQQKENAVESLFDLFSYLINNKSNDPKPLVNFIAYLGICQVQRLQQISLEFCLYGQNNRFFTELLIQILNEQIDQQALNRYTAFIYILYQKDNDSFYQNDIKMLIQIITRELQMYRSDLNQLINLQVINILAIKNRNILEFKKAQISAILEQIVSVGNEYNKSIAKSIYQLIIA